MPPTDDKMVYVQAALLGYADGDVLLPLASSRHPDDREILIFREPEPDLAKFVPYRGYANSFGGRRPNGGFVFRILRPHRYRDMIFCIHHDGPIASGDPYRNFQTNRIYRMRVSVASIGKLDFSACQGGPNYTEE
jgi:hypothetical protein